MKNVRIFVQEIEDSSQKIVGKVAILRGEPNLKDPKIVMDQAVDIYVGNKPHNQFIEIFLDNPWVRVIVGGINEIDYENFDKQRL